MGTHIAPCLVTMLTCMETGAHFTDNPRQRQPTTPKTHRTNQKVKHEHHTSKDTHKDAHTTTKDTHKHTPRKHTHTHTHKHTHPHTHPEPHNRGPGAQPGPRPRARRRRGRPRTGARRATRHSSTRRAAAHQAPCKCAIRLACSAQPPIQREAARCRSAVRPRSAKHIRACALRSANHASPRSPMSMR